MRHQLKGLAIILVMVLAFVIPEAHGFAIKSTSDGPNGLESFAFRADIDGGGYFSVHAVPNSAYKFNGDSGDIKFSKKYSTGSIWSEAGFDIQNAQAYDVALWGDKSDSAKRTNAYLDLLATADYIKAYGKSSTGTYQSGATLTVNAGSADVAIEAHADGKKLASTTTLGTDYQGPLGAITTSSTIDVSSYYKGGKSTGKLTAYVDNGAIEGYSLLATSGKSDNGAKQSADSALGDVVKFSSQTNKNIPGSAGTNKALSANTEIRDGYIYGYTSHIIDTPKSGYGVDQSFNEAGGITPYYEGIYAAISAYTKYVETSKNSKKQAEQQASGNGEWSGYSSIATDPSASQYVAVAGGNAYFNSKYKEITKSASKWTESNTQFNGGYIENFNGNAWSNADSSGTLNVFGIAQANEIHTSNLYQDNKGPQGGNGRVGVDTYPDVFDPTDPMAASVTGYSGIATFTPTGEKDVRAQGQTDQRSVNIYSEAHGTPGAYYGYSGYEPWYNYFYGQAASPGSGEPWTATAVGGHRVGESETIQNAINSMPYNGWGYDGNIFLDEKTYNENNIRNDLSGEKSFTLWGAGSYIKNAGNSVIDAGGAGRAFDLYSNVYSNWFNFKNIDFNNGNTAGQGGAMLVNRPAELLASTVNIEKCNFNNNQAAQGGAIFSKVARVNIKDSTFNSNTANNAGGAIYNLQGEVTVQDSSFTGNTAAASWGGAILNTDINGLNTDPAARLILTGCTFTNNQALGWNGKGGAVANEYQGNSATGSEVTATNNLFVGNHAEFDGGAYYAANAGTITTMTTNDFQNNIADNNGGAAYILAGVHNDVENENTFSGNSPNGVTYA